MTDIEVHSQMATHTLPPSPGLPQKRPFEAVDGGRSAIDLVHNNGDSVSVGQNASSEPNVVEVEKSLPTTSEATPTLPPNPVHSQPMAIPSSATPDPVNPTSTDAAEASILTSIPAPNTTLPPPPQTPGAGSTIPNKRQKLSPASKAAKQQEKEARERQRAEEKVKKEEERKRKEEEKRKRDEEREDERKKREEKKKAKEEEKLAKEEEKRKKEEEKTKKERSQMRLNAFFTKPPASISASEKNLSVSTPTSTSNHDGSNFNSTEEVTVEKESASDYSQQFPPFFVQSHTSIAPMHRFERDSDSLKHMHEKVDAIFQNRDDSSETALNTHFRPADVFHLMPYKRRHGSRKHPTVKEILIAIQDSASRPIDLTGDDKQDNDGTRNNRPENSLKEVPMKTLRFHEDVRPPYQGTFTRRLPSPDAKRLCRNPFSRTIPDMNYDYDSEAEWEEPEEGEDLTSENEEEASDDGGEDMEGFLDDGDDEPVNGKRRIIVGDLEPVSSGIRWEGEGEVDDLFKSHRMELISDTLQFPIDPFSSSYWAKPAPVQPQRTQQPGHIPLHSSPLVKGPNSSLSKQFFGIPQQGATSSIGATAGQGTDLDASRLLPAQIVLSSQQKPRRPFPPDQVAEFKSVVAGSDLTKAGLIEVLKKRFPKISKEVIKDTLSSTAVRLGQKEADKKWVLI